MPAGGLSALGFRRAPRYWRARLNYKAGPPTAEFGSPRSQGHLEARSLRRAAIGGERDEGEGEGRGLNHLYSGAAAVIESPASAVGTLWGPVGLSPTQGGRQVFGNSPKCSPSLPSPTLSTGRLHRRLPTERAKSERTAFRVDTSKGG